MVAKWSWYRVTMIKLNTVQAEAKWPTPETKWLDRNPVMWAGTSMFNTIHFTITVSFWPLDDWGKEQLENQDLRASTKGPRGSSNLYLQLAYVTWPTSRRHLRTMDKIIPTSSLQNTLEFSGTNNISTCSEATIPGIGALSYTQLVMLDKPCPRSGPCDEHSIPSSVLGGNHQAEDKFKFVLKQWNVPTHTWESRPWPFKMENEFLGRFCEFQAMHLEGRDHA